MVSFSLKGIQGHMRGPMDLTKASSLRNERYVEIGSKMEVYESYFLAR